MIEIKQIQTGTRQLKTVDNRDALGVKGLVEHIIEVEQASESIDETERLDVIVFGVPFVGIVITGTPTAHTYYKHLGVRDYVIRLVAKEGYDYSQFLKPDWGDDDEC